MGYSKAEKEKIEELYFQNIKIEKIAELMNSQIKDIKHYIKESGLVEKRKKYYKELIDNALENQITINELAEKMNCSTYKVSNIASELKIKTYFRKIRQEQREKKIIEEYKKEPLNIKQMSKKLKISYSIVMKVYQNNNIKYYRKENLYQKLNKNKHEEIIRLLKETDMSLSEIARKYNVSKQWIFTIKKKNNIKR